ncbi:hypothetical protein JJL56_01955 [Azospirillum sp. YIM DDC1]|uniref:Uncharacterized protein n=1 Tax=Azospirillum aestuarii TaxID=2802052 RepID=A0ABS1HTJ8_9PROT|nr:hypothetical protein [Azospirillum aestuarii]MBK4717623.1 hypothetical protein [Azospirillum aestuarii]
MLKQSMANDPGSVFERIVGFAQDPRADHMMAIGFAMAVMEELGPHGWKLIDRERFLRADPGHNEESHWRTIERSMAGKNFICDHFFAVVQRLQSPVAAAVTITVLYRDLLADGMEQEAYGIAERVHLRLRQHMREM